METKEKVVDFLSEYFKKLRLWLSLLTRPSITFVCFCASGDFCHRLLLADYFTKIGAVYMGERKQVSKLVWE